jgi:hypothetical protein
MTSRPLTWFLRVYTWVGTSPKARRREMALLVWGCGRYNGWGREVVGAGEGTESIGSSEASVAFGVDCIGHISTGEKAQSSRPIEVRKTASAQTN